MEAVIVVRVAQMTDGDLPLVVALEKECGLNSRGVDGYRKILPDQNAILLVAIEDSEDRCIVGMFSGSVVVDEMQIDNLAVNERYRRMGIGQILLASALSSAARLGAVVATLEVRSANLPARAFYEKEGFALVGFRKRYYAAPSDDALLLTREIQIKS